MAEIYKSQVNWSTPGTIRVGAARVQDYLSEGFKALQGVSQDVADNIKNIQDKRAAATMENAALQASEYIDNFDDFSGDNYEEKMMQGAKNIWDEAYNSLDRSVQNRFATYNPESENLFLLKTKESVLKKTYDYAVTQEMRRIPMEATKLTSLYSNPSDIRKALEDKVYEVSENTKMAPQDIDKWVDSFTKEVAEGSISMAIGRGDYDSANALLHDKEITSQFTPAYREKLRRSIASAKEAEAKAEIEELKGLSKQKKDEAVADLVAGVNYIMGSEQFGATPEERYLYASKFLTATMEGEDIKQTINGKDFVIPSFLKDAERSARMNIVAAAAKEAFENDPISSRKRAEITTEASMLMSRNEEKALSEWDRKDIIAAQRVVEQSKGLYYYDAGARKVLDDLENVVYRTNKAVQLAIKPSATYATDDYDVRVRTGIGVFRHVSPAGLWENLTPEEMHDLANGGVGYSPEMAQKIADSVYDIMYVINKDDEPKNGTYMETIAATIALLSYMPEETKALLGVGGVPEQAIASALLPIMSRYEDQDLLEEFVDNSHRGADEPDTSDAVGQLSLLWGKEVEGMEELNKGSAFEKASDPSVPIEKSQFTNVVRDVIMSVNKDAKIDEKALLDFAAMLRRGTYEHKYWTTSIINDRDAYIRTKGDRARNAAKMYIDTPVEASK